MTGASRLDLWTGLGDRCTFRYRSAFWIVLTDLRLGSRDRTIRLWKMDDEKGHIVYEALYTRSVHKVMLSAFCLASKCFKDKVRDVKYSPEPNRIISFSTDGDVRVWDPLDLRGILSVSVPFKKERKPCFSNP